MLQMRIEREAGSSSSMDNQILEDVLGAERHDEVLFVGSGVTPSAYFGGSSSQQKKRLRTTDLLMRLRSVEGENIQLKAHLDELQQQHENMKKEYKEEIQELRRQQDEQTIWLRRVFNGPSGSQPTSGS